MSSSFASTLFTDCSNWNSHVANIIVDDDFTADIANNDSIVLSSGILSVGSNGLTNSALNYNRASNGRFETRIRNNTGTAGYSSLRWSFIATPVSSICADFNSISSSRGIQIRGLLNGNSVFTTSLFSHFSNTSIGSFGIISDTSFNSIEFIAQGTGSDDLFYIDNVKLATDITLFADGFEGNGL